MDKDVKYFVDRVENGDRRYSSHTDGYLFFSCLFIQGIFLFPVSFLICWPLNNYLLLMGVGLLFFAEIIYSFVVCGFYKKNRFIKSRAVTCYVNGEVIVECKEGSKKLSIQDIKKISYRRFWVPASYVYYDYRLRGGHWALPFFKLSDEGILKLKTNDFTNYIYVVNNLKSKKEYFEKFILNKN